MKINIRQKTDFYVEYLVKINKGLLLFISLYTTVMQELHIKKLPIYIDKLDF